MGRVYRDNSESIGNTPLVRLNRLTEGGRSTVLGKIEGRNPAYSVKCRIGASMIWDAETRGVLRPGMEVIEPTSGNTGIALAYVCAARGYRVRLTMPETMSMERRRVLQHFGAGIELTPGWEGMPGAIRRAEELVANDPNHFFMPQQFKNPANPRIHEQTTGPELWADIGDDLDVLVAGVGTGGTLTGVSRYFEREHDKPLYSVAVEPEASPVITQHLAGREMTPAPHKIQGIGAGFIPDTLDLALVDRVETVSDDEAFECARRLAMEEGILCGISCGAAVAVALRLGRCDEFADKTIAVILPDAGERYLSTPLFRPMENNN